MYVSLDFEITVAPIVQLNIKRCALKRNLAIKMKRFSEFKTKKVDETLWAKSLQIYSENVLTDDF